MWQSRLVANVLQQAPVEQDISGHISGSLAPENLLQIYRHNYFSRMQEALQATFRKTEAMLGSAFFKQVSHDFILAKPYQEASLLNFGAIFSAYLKDTPQLSQLAYVADLAALEWAMEEVYNAQRRLSYESVRLNPAMKLVASDYALLDIWQYTGTESAELDVCHQAQWVLVVWVQGDIRLQAFDQQQGELLQAIMLTDYEEQQLAFSQLPKTTTNWLLNIGVLV